MWCGNDKSAGCIQLSVRRPLFTESCITCFGVSLSGVWCDIVPTTYRKMKPFKDKYEHLSGAQKRKKKRELEKETNKLVKISSFFSVPSNNASSTDTQVCSVTSEVKSDNSNCVIEKDCDKIACSVASECPSELKSENGKCVSENDYNIITDYSNDRADYQLDVDEVTKRFFVMQNPYQPAGPFPKDASQENRSFSTKFYEKFSLTGQRIWREWLCYSTKNDSVYCRPCWLFGGQKSSTWREGVRDWRWLTKSISRHETSHAHMKACAVFSSWRNKNTVDASMASDLKKCEKIWKQVLERIANVTLTLASNNIAFRGHREEIGKSNSGNFLAVVELLAKYDPVLSDLINKPKYTQKYLSPTIQNELISVLSRAVETEIINDIKSAPFFSIITDTTQDITKKDQLTQIFRYVSVSHDIAGKPCEVKINESFLGFREIKDQSALGIENDILSAIDEKGLLLTKCRGQGYDGCATMSGIYKGVRTRIQQRQKNAKYVHCGAHNLNLVLNDAACGIREVKSFYDTVETLYIFFSHSIKRWDILVSSCTLKKLCPTRWSSRYQSVKALRYAYVDVLKALSKIILTSQKREEREQAAVLKNQLEKFEFVFLIVLQSKILECTNLASKIMQSENIELDKACSLVRNAADSLSCYRSNFEEAMSSATSLANTWGISPKFENKRFRKVKKHFDELCQDERIVDQNMYFRTAVFNGCLDVIVAQLKNRFEAMHNINHFFKAIFPKFLNTASDEEIYNAAVVLQNEYDEDLSSEFPDQVIGFKNALKKEIASVTTVVELTKLLIIENSIVAASVPDLCTALYLFLTIPVTVSSAERSFSKLKLIKNYLRNSMTQDRLSELSLLSIESERARSIDINEIINTFASQKARRMVQFH